MALWSAFIGADHSARSPALDAEVSINLYKETLGSAEAAAGYNAQSGNTKRTVLYGTPGLKLLVVAPDVGCRGLYACDGTAGTRVFAVVGSTFGELTLSGGNWLWTTRGAVANDRLPVSMAANGRATSQYLAEQVLIVSGGQVYVFTLTTNVLSAAVSLPLANAPVMCAYLDTYFLLTEANTNHVWFSNLGNGLIWGALNFFTRSDVNDNIVGLKVLGNRIWTFGSRTTELFYDSGNALTPFVPYPGTAINEGAAAPWGIAVHGESVTWLVQSPLGQTRIAMASSASAQAISTVELGYSLGTYATLADAEVLNYEQENHAHAAWTFPTADKTWCYDAKESSWHQRAGWDAPTSSLHRWRARGCCTVGKQVLVGDYANGNIYQLDLETFTDNGVTLPRIRRAPYLSAENQWLFLDSFELGIQPGVGVTAGQGSAPLLQLRVSRDLANTWSLGVISGTTSGPGALGQYGARALWNRLGRARADRLALEVQQTDPVRCVWGPGAWLRATPGTNQL